MRILVTGDCGFIGSRVKEKLEQCGYSIVGYDLFRGKNLLDLENLKDVVTLVDVVFHIAAQADLTQMTSIEGSRKGVLNNIEATHNVAYLCAKYKKWLIYASTLCVYGNHRGYFASEDTTLPDPSELYACSKYAGEWIVKGYGKNHQMPWTIERFATVYGPAMREALGLSIFFRQAMNNKPITVHGDGCQTRTLTFVDDLIDGIIAPLKYPNVAKGETFNLSSRQSISAMKMAKDVKNITNSNSAIVHIPQRKNQIIHERVNTTKAKKLLKWEAKIDWKDGLQKTYEWIQSQHV